MLRFFRSAPKTGTDAINEALGQFEDIASRLTAGAQDNHENIAANDEQIAALKAENETLAAHAARAHSVAGKLRELIA